MKDNDIESKERKKQSLLRKLFHLKGLVQKEKNEREHVGEIKSLEEQINKTDDEILQAKVEAAKEKIAELQREALELQARKKSLLEEIEKIDERFFELLKAAEEAVPKRKVQTSSKNFVKIVKTIQIPRMLFNPFGPPDKEFEDKIEELTVEAIPSKLEFLFSEGWSLKDREKVEPEELTPENSREVQVFSLPEIFKGYEQCNRLLTWRPSF